jgi:isopentenyl-diphosphate delta-isomerase
LLSDRKNDHLEIVLRGQSRSGARKSFDDLQFEHVALPELDMSSIDLSTRLFGKRISAPLLVSSMTGGPKRAARINRNLALACEEIGIALAVGSQRIAIEEGANSGIDRELRQLAPTAPLLANFGAAQLNLGFGLDEARRAVDMIGADALIIHLNPLQEALQPEGNRDWRGLLAAISTLARNLGAPIVTKEVGAGISAEVARRLLDAGVSAIDVAGTGGTSWAAVEAERCADPQDKAVALAFADWGQPTAWLIAEVRAACPEATIIGSGGIRHGIDAAKAICLGADLVAQAAAVLQAAVESPEAVVRHFRVLLAQLRVACFCTGSADLAALRQARLLSVSGGVQGVR